MVAGTDILGFFVHLSRIAAFQCCINALRNIRGLLVKRCQNSASVGVEPVLGPGIPDLFHRFTHDGRNIHIFRFGADFADYEDKPGSYGNFARHTSVRIVLKECVKNRIGDLVANFIRVPFGYGLGSK
ncbi:hypothetical protein D1872_253660 [compost metagenome]